MPELGFCIVTCYPVGKIIEDIYVIYLGRNLHHIWWNNKLLRNWQGDEIIRTLMSAIELKAFAGFLVVIGFCALIGK